MAKYTNDNEFFHLLLNTVKDKDAIVLNKHLNATNNSDKENDPFGDRNKKYNQLIEQYTTAFKERNQFKNTYKKKFFWFIIPVYLIVIAASLFILISSMFVNNINLAIILGALSIINYIQMDPNTEIEKSQEPQEAEKIVKMYEAIIGDLIGKSKGIMQGAKYISLDVSSLKAPGTSTENYLELTEEQKNKLTEYCQKYNEEVKNKSLEGLREEGLVEDTNGFIAIEGVLIRILQIEKLTENKAVIEVQAFRTGLGAVMIEYELKYKNGEWKLTAGPMAIS